jgi:hypothetical protein
MQNAAQMKARMDDIVSELRALFGHSELADLKRKFALRSEHAQLAAKYHVAEQAEQAAKVRAKAAVKAAATRKYRKAQRGC